MTSKQVNDIPTELTTKQVQISIQSKLIWLKGQWRWDLQSQAVYCSDVMSFPVDFEGAKGILHPDDVSQVKDGLEILQKGEMLSLQFRIITTYGEVKMLEGTNVSINTREPLLQPDPELEPWHEALENWESRKTLTYLKQRIEFYDAVERLQGLGSWYMNTDTNEAFYSDNIFRIHGMAAQSLNAHANTFYPFIHPEDAIAVMDALEKAYAQQVPVHLEYRIIKPDGVVRHVQLVTAWHFNQYGQHIFTGLLKDCTEQNEISEKLAQAETNNFFHKGILQFNEQHTTSGNWYINLFTKKITFSDNYFRIYGFRQNNLSQHNTFLNLVHPDDHDAVAKAIERMYREHVLPEMEFRIIRPDGKMRHLRQSGKLMIHGIKDMVLVGTVQDITMRKELERNVQELNEKITLQKNIQELLEDAANISAVVWYLPDETMFWTDGFYKLLGYKPGTIEPFQRILHKSIHPADLKTFNDVFTMVLNNQSHDPISLRIIARGSISQVMLSFYHIQLTEKPAVAAIVQDISTQATLEQQLTERTEFAAQLGNTIPDVIIVTNTNHTITNWNRCAEQKTGIKAGDALFKNLFDVLPQLKDENYVVRLQSVLHGESITYQQARDGYHKGYYELHLAPLRNNMGDITGVLHVAHDINKERELQVRLSERLNFIENLVEASVDRIIVLDRNMNYLYWNKQAEIYYGIQKNRVLGKNIMEVFPAFRNDPTYQEFRRVLKGDTVHQPAYLEKDSTEYFETYLIPVKSEKGDVLAVLWMVHDLSSELQLQQEQAKAASLLQKEHHTLKEAQAIGHVGSFEWDTISNEIYWSDEMYRIYGLEPQSELINIERVLGFIHPEDKERSFDELQECRQKPITMTLTHRIKRVDGAIRYITRKLQSFADATGTITHIIGTVQDITEQVQAKEQIQKQELQYRSLVENTPDVITRWDKDLNLIYVNYDFEAKTGVSYQSLFGENNGGAVQQDASALPWTQILQNVFETGAPIEVFNSFNTPVGEVHFFSRIVPEKNATGDIETVLGIARDITELKKAEQELLQMKDKLAQQATDKYLSLLNNMEQGFCIIEMIFNDADEPVDYRFLEVNPVFEKQTGLKNATGKTMRQLEPAHEEHWFQIYGDIAKTGKPAHFENIAAHLIDGVWYEVYAFRIGDPEDCQIAVLFNDITERKRHEANLAFLTELSYVFSRLSSAEEIMQTIGEKMGAYLKLITINFIDIDLSKEQEMTVSYCWSKPGFANLVGQFRIKDFLTADFERACRAGETFIINNTQTDSRTDAIAYENLKIGAFVGIPFFRNGEWKYLLSVTDLQPRKWLPDEIELIQELTSRIFPRLERARAEEALRTSEERLKKALSIDTVGVLFFNLNGQITDMNTAFERMTGYSRKELQSNIHWETLTPPEFSDATLQAAEELVKTGETAPYEKEFICKDGTRLWVLCAAKRLSGTGKDSLCMEFVLDITAKKHAEQQLKDFNALLEHRVTERTHALQESKDLLRSVIDSKLVSVSVYKAVRNEANKIIDLEWVFANHITQKLAGNMSLEGRCYSEIFPEVTSARILQKYIDVIETGTPIDEELYYKNEAKKIDGWFHMTGEKRNDGLIVNTEDITSRKKAEDELFKNLNLLQQAEEVAGMGSWDYRIGEINMRWSEGMYQLFDLKQGANVKPETYLNFAAKEDRSVAKAIMQKLHNGEESFENTLTIETKTGVRKVIKIKAVAIKDSDGKPLHMLGVDLDITDLMHTEERLKALNRSLDQRNKELEAKNEELSNFSFIASHDLREPLRKIHTFSDWLLKRERENLSETGKNYLGRMSVSVERMDQLIEDVLVLTKMHASVFEAQEVNLNAIVNYIKAELAEIFESTKTVITTAVLPTIQGNKIQLQHLFKNLIVNAIKFQKPGNQPQLSIDSNPATADEIVNLGLNIDHAYTRICFIDNGIGIDKKYTHKIFQIFQRLHPRSEYEGTGIGLTICKKVMENHQGTITMESTPGKGTCFCCYFPVTEN